MFLLELFISSYLHFKWRCFGCDLGFLFEGIFQIKERDSLANNKPPVISSYKGKRMSTKFNTLRSSTNGKLNFATFVSLILAVQSVQSGDWFNWRSTAKNRYHVLCVFDILRDYLHPLCAYYIMLIIERNT